MSARRPWHGQFSKTLKKHGVTWGEFKKNPSIMMEKDPSIYNWLSAQYEPDEQILWYNKQTTLRQMLQEGNKNFYEKLIAEGTLSKGNKF